MDIKKLAVKGYEEGLTAPELDTELEQSGFSKEEVWETIFSLLITSDEADAGDTYKRFAHIVFRVKQRFGGKLPSPQQVVAYLSSLDYGNEEITFVIRFIAVLARLAVLEKDPTQARKFDR